MLPNNLSRLCNAQPPTSILQSINSCMANRKHSAIKSLRLQFVYLICIEIIFYVIFGIITQNFNPANVFKIGYPVMSMVFLFFIIVLAVSYVYPISIGKKMIRICSGNLNAIRMSSAIFTFESESDQQIGNDASDRHIRSLRFSYKDKSTIKYISFGKSQRGFFYDKLSIGGKYRFLTVNETYFLIIRDEKSLL